MYVSFFADGFDESSKFVGIKNYVNLFRDSTFTGALKNNIFDGDWVVDRAFAVGACFFGNILFQKIKGSHFFPDSVFFCRVLSAGWLWGLTWTFVYNSEFGLLNKFLEIIGLESLQHVWLSDKNLALFCIIVVVMWQFVGYHMIIQLAAMKNIPSSYYEAAEIDGASKWVQFKSITFPLIKPILKVDAVLIITGSLKYYDLIAVMTGGGPNHATELMSTYMFYQGFRTLKYGYSAGIGVILLILCMCSVLLSNLVFRSEPVEF